MHDAKLDDEYGRIACLHRYEVLDSEPEQPFDKITSLVKTVLKVPICAVSLVDRERQWFKSIVGLDARQTPRAISFCTHTVRSREPLVINDAALDSRFSDNPLVLGAPFIRSYAGAPLQSPEGYNLGSLCAIDTEPRSFDEAELGVLKSFAALVVDELELRRIAERDHLTGALTRRGFTAQVEKEIGRFDRHNRPSALLTFDIDHFKSVNDTFGHPFGDEVLKAVAACCEHGLRPSDTFGRMGGEEFAILAAETSAADALLCAERFRSAVARLRFDGRPDFRVTASFGIAPLTRERCDLARWLADVDAALYAAKRSGRNRSVMADAVRSDVAA